MNRQELLDLAWVELEISAEGLRYAEDFLTEDQVKAKVKQLEDDLGGMEQVKARAMPFYYGIGALGIGATWWKFADEVPFSLCIGFSALILLACCALGSVLVRQLNDNMEHIKKSLKLLAPILDTDACLEAKRLLDAGEPAVVAWRDLVLADRAVLRLFDVHMFKALHTGALRQRRKLEQKQACQAIHGVPVADTSFSTK